MNEQEHVCGLYMDQIQILMTAVNESRLDEETKAVTREWLDMLSDIRMTHTILRIVAEK